MEEYTIILNHKKGVRAQIIDTKYETITAFLQALDSLKKGEQLIIEKTKNK